MPATALHQPAARGLATALLAALIVAAPAPAQESEVAMVLPEGRLAPSRRAGEPLAVEVLHLTATTLTVEARVDRAAVAAGGDDEPFTYAALLAVPAGPVEAVEVERVRFLAAAAETPVSIPWRRPADAKPGSSLVAVEDLGWLRHQHLVRLVVHPRLIDPAALEPPRLLSLTVHLRFADGAAEAAPEAAESPAFDLVLQRGLADPGAVAPLRARPPVPAPAGAPLLPDPTLDHLVLHTPADTLVAVSGRDLRRAGVDLRAIEPERLKLHHRGQELPLLVSGAVSGVDDGTALIFFAPAIPRDEADTVAHAVLALSWGEGAGRRMAERPAWLGDEARDGGSFRVVRRLEEDRVEEGGRWYWCRLSAEPGAPDSRFVVLPDVASLVPGDTVELRLALLGLTDVPTAPVDHHVRVVVNNRWTRDLTWNGRIPYVMIDELPSELLYPGDNVIEILLPGELEVFADQVLLDWIEVRYPTWGERRPLFQFTATPPGGPALVSYEVYNQRGRSLAAFDLTDPLQPIALTGPRLRQEALDSVLFQHSWFDDTPRVFAVADLERLARPAEIVLSSGSRDLRRSGAGADLLVVAHPDLVDGLTGLVEHRRGQGLRVEVVTTAEIAAAFGHGTATPEAIRDLARHAFLTWPAPAPAFLLLVGDATADPLDRQGHGGVDLVPAFARTRGAYPADAWYGLLSEGDHLPDLLVGRLAVASAAEAAAVVAKIVAFEGGRGPWRRRVLHIADDDPNDRFEAAAAAAAERLSALGLSVDSLAVGALGLPPDLPLPDRVERVGAGLTPRVVAALEGGVGLVQYFGHGGHRVWAHEHVLDARPGAGGPIDGLRNLDQLPVVLSFSCLTTAFDHPRFATIAERLVNHPRGGAVAFYGASGNSANPRAWTVSTAITEIAESEAEPRLGSALALATLERIRAAGLGPSALLDSNLLIGDPALVLSPPPETE